MNDNARTALRGLLEHIAGAYAANTIRAYRADMSEFIRYCESQNLQPLPAEATTVAAFLMTMPALKIKNATINRKVSSISAIHRLSYLPDPTKHPEVKLVLRKLHRQLGCPLKQAYPVTHPVLGRLLKATGDTLRGLRDQALLMLAYDSMRRRAELVSLRVEDIDRHSEGTSSILLRRSKTDQTGTGSWLHISRATTLALDKWLQAAQIERGFVLRGVKYNNVATDTLGAGQIGRIYKYLARRAKLSDQAIRSISGHSMRVGGAQDLLNQGASLPQIMVKGGWSKTDTVMRYVSRVASHAHAPLGQPVE